MGDRGTRAAPAADGGRPSTARPRDATTGGRAPRGEAGSILEAEERFRALEQAVHAVLASAPGAPRRMPALGLLPLTAVSDALHRTVQAAEGEGAAEQAGALGELREALLALRRHYPPASPLAEQIALVRWLCDALERECAGAAPRA